MQAQLHRPTARTGSRALLLAAFALLGALSRPAFGQSTVATIDVGLVGANDVGIVTINPVTNLVYFFGQLRGSSSGADGVSILDVATGTVTHVPLPEGFSYWSDLVGDNTQSRQYAAINPATNLIYMLGAISYPDGNQSQVLAVLDGSTNTVSTVPIDVRTFQFAGGIAVNPTTNMIYATGVLAADGGWVGFGVLAIDGATNTVTNVYQLNGPDGCAFDDIAEGDGTGNGGIAVNAVTNQIYVTGSNCGAYLAVVDGTTGGVTLLPMPPSMNAVNWPVAVDPNTNDVFVLSSTNANLNWDVVVANGTTGQVSAILPIPQLPYGQPTGLAFDPSTNRLYLSLLGQGIGIADLATGTVTTALNLLSPSFSLNPAVDPTTNQLYEFIEFTSGPATAEGMEAVVIDLGISSVTTGSNVVVQADAATVTFDTVASPGSISVTPIADPAMAGDVPGGFAISDVVAYEVSPSSSLVFTGSVTTCFQVPGVNDPTVFASLRVLHQEAGVLVDRTSSQDFSTRTLCATTTSFSPFYIARLGNHVSVLFDQTRAYHAGSTIPIRLQMQSQAGANISSSSLTLTTRSLTSLGAGTELPVIDAGNANPDSEFRYDSAGYIFNLSTKGLVSGRYCLSFWAGTDMAFAYDVVFEIR